MCVWEGGDFNSIPFLLIILSFYLSYIIMLHAFLIKLGKKINASQIFVIKKRKITEIRHSLLPVC